MSGDIWERLTLGRSCRCVLDHRERSAPTCSGSVEPTGAKGGEIGQRFVVCGLLFGEIVDKGASIALRRRSQGLRPDAAVDLLSGEPECSL
jgi:hypothetical protein